MLARPGPPSRRQRSHPMTCYSPTHRRRLSMRRRDCDTGSPDRGGSSAQTATPESIPQAVILIGNSNDCATARAAATCFAVPTFRASYAALSETHKSSTAPPQAYLVGEASKGLIHAKARIDSPPVREIEVASTFQSRHPHPVAPDDVASH